MWLRRRTIGSRDSAKKEDLTSSVAILLFLHNRTSTLQRNIIHPPTREDIHAHL